jgi:predicted AAA+ superfamily ATPase
MIPRLVHAAIDDALGHFPVVGLIGSRQVGKSTLARTIMNQSDKKSVYLDLELPSDLQKLREAELYLENHSDKLVIIDEIQRKPELFPLIRSLVDRWSRNGSFLILGSASPALIRQSSESLAGRILYRELSPFLTIEVGADPETIRRLWLRGGYPRSYLADSDEASMQWRVAFGRTYLERDIPQLGIRVPSSTLDRFWTMIAHAHGQLWNASKIAQSLGISPPTCRHYLDILEETFVVRQLKPYHSNVRKRLVKSPKVYFRDSGLLHMLHGIPTIEDLFGHPVVGASWEGMVIEQIINSRPDPNGRFFFYRTATGAEIDLIYQASSARPPVAIEAKLSAAPSLTRGFWEGMKDLQCEKGYVVYSGTERYPMAKNVTALPAANLKEIFARK